MKKLNNEIKIKLKKTERDLNITIGYCINLETKEIHINVLLISIKKCLAKILTFKIVVITTAICISSRR